MRAGWFLLPLVIASACRPTETELSPEPREAELARAESAARALSEELAGRLFEELDRSGPLGAVDVCSRVAQQIAREHSRDGLVVRRVSLKVRNPADEPDDWERAQLRAMEGQLAAGGLPGAVSAVLETESGSELRYLQPIRVGPGCLACHGEREEMDPQLVSRLTELYPQDAAVGYQPGDLRGAVSVRLALEGADGGSADE